MIGYMERIKKKWVLASDNAGKLREFSVLFQALAIEMVPQASFSIQAITENGLSFVENAIAKARHASQLSGLPALADDSGLIVAALGGKPGIFSARYAGLHANAQANIAKLLQAMSNFPIEKRDAFFYCVLVFMAHPQDPAPIICEGRWQGRILEKPQGSEGFGYDPIFFVPALGKSAAELSLAIKNQVSHRALALQALTERLRETI